MHRDRCELRLDTTGRVELRPMVGRLAIRSDYELIFLEVR